MEQSIDAKTKPEFAAGTDPAFIPGLTAPAPAVTDKEPKKEAETEPAESEVLAERTEDTGSATGSDAGSEPAPEDAVPSESAAGGAEQEKEEEGDSPVFEVSDRRGSIRVARAGVRFTLDDQEAEFDWDEIGAVEMKPARFGRRFTVTVHLTTRRWFNAEVEAPARNTLKEWTAELDTVLDAYFEES